MPSELMHAGHQFHQGERAVQARLGVAERMTEVGKRVIRDFLPEQFRQFFEQLPFVLVGSVDGLGRPWASVLVGEPGFMCSSDPRRLDIAARPIDGDPLAEGLRTGAPLGFLGIELSTRRRNRMNGHVSAREGDGFSVRVDQTVGNCPQYIQGRDYGFVRDSRDVRPRRREAFTTLDADAQAHIAAADTLFVATYAPAAAGEAARGADVSHRGGRGGFVKIEDERTLLIPDFAGNLFFMTLGNIALNPVAGLLFIDFERGDVLTLTGRAEIVWEDEAISDFEGAERAWRFHLDSGLRLRDALPLRWILRDFSPNSLLTGTWSDAARRREAERLASTWRPYRVNRIVEESSVIRSLHLEPADGHAVPAFEAGQYLPIRLRPPGSSADLRRTYTISTAPTDPGLRLSVKRESSARPEFAPGVASNFLHDHVRVGGIVEALGPQGRFTIDARAQRPAVLIAAGVGVTPMIAFLRHIVAEGFRHRRMRPLHFIQVAHDSTTRAFRDELHELEARGDGMVKVHLILGHPTAQEQSGKDYTLRGPLTVAMLKSLLPFDDHEFYLCGPGGFMQMLYDGLRDLGVRDERVHAEAFGPASLQRRHDAAAAPAAAPVAERASVTFVRSAEGAAWTPEKGTLLEFAEGEGLSPPFGCRAGQCGSCSTRLLSGQVVYRETPSWRPAEGEVLLCCAVPGAGGGETIELDI